MAIRNRLYPVTAEESVLRGHCGHARYVWNLAVEQGSWWRPGRKSAPGWVDQNRQLTEARAASDWLRAGSRSVQRQALRDFDRALTAFFDKSRSAGKPGFRSSKGPQGFVIETTKVCRLNRRWGAVFVPKLGYVKFRWTRDLPINLGEARVTLDGVGRWHVTFTGPQPGLDRKPTGAAVGIDRGVRTALVTSEGQHYRVPRISDRRAARYLALSRRMNRQRKGSAKRARTKRAMAVITSDVVGRRKDWAEKISTRLVRENDLVVLEKLNIGKMTRKPKPKPDPDRPGEFLPSGTRQKAGLNRGILASAWGVLGERLNQKAAASGSAAIFVHPRFTSQQCHVCGHTAKENRESQAVFRCVECGHTDHADANAARNILARGLLLTTGEIVPAHAPGHGASRPRQPAQAAAGTTRAAA